ncbi:hypothetical protein HNY73_008229 [Argiope bruennichi]|uniref:Uncharacterized protein n=1 Tax=Argiope bruennichi TaxID=94029 RepID=A0A8T0FAS3_ARGBR|nr:hypothetical protein HNY73_008229 [Argiope bruennichi]
MRKKPSAKKLEINLLCFSENNGGAGGISKDEITRWNGIANASFHCIPLYHLFVIEDLMHPVSASPEYDGLTDELGIIEWNGRTPDGAYTLCIRTYYDNLLEF